MKDHAIIYMLHKGTLQCLKIITLKGYHEITDVQFSILNPSALVVLYGKQTTQGKKIIAQEYDIDTKNWKNLNIFEDQSYGHRLS